MDLRAYLDILRRRGWIILAVALLACVLTLGVSMLQTKIYRATVRVSAVPARPDWGLGQQAKDLLRNFVNNIDTHDMANQVIADAQLDMNSYQLLAKMTVSAEPDNFIIRIDAEDRDPEIAKKIAKTTADLFVNERRAYYETQDKANRIEVKLVDTVIDAPLYKPKLTTNGLAGGVIGGLIGALIVLALEWMAGDILATPQAVERLLDLPVPGTIPAVAAASAVRNAKLSATPANAAPPRRLGRGQETRPMSVDLITLTDPSSPASEAYRRLRTNLTSVGNGAPLKTLLVASAGPDNNKAEAAANLAVTFAKIGKQVILVDADLRHPAQHRLFGLSNDAGVSTAFGGKAAELPLQATAAPCLRVLTSGPAVESPSDLIASPGMGQLIARLCEEADLVIFDAPPVVLATDAAELATQVDGVLLTVSSGHTKREDAQQAKELLAKVGARLVGAAMVNVPLDAALRKYLAA
jgi:capsular exopolysaccharide synthesis family protein